MSIQVPAQGSLLKVGDGASPEVFTTFPGITKMETPNAQRSFNDVTSHDSSGGYMEWSPGLLDGGEIPIDCLWDPTNAVQIATVADCNSANLLRNYKITTANHVKTYAFSAYPSMTGPLLEKGKPMTAQIKLRVTGPTVVT